MPDPRLEQIKVGDEVTVRATVKEINPDSYLPVVLHVQASAVDADSGYVMVDMDAVVVPEGSED